MSDPWQRWRRVLAERPLPAAVVDLDALDHNVSVLVGALDRAIPVRVASKSVRVPALLRHLLQHERLQGLMTFSAAEASLLAEQGFDDLLNGYPVARAADAERFAALAERGVRAIAMVDAPGQVDLLAAAARTTIPVCLDIDASLRVGPAHLGVRRSPLRGADAALGVARHIRGAPGVELVGIMAYEAQVAGLPDHAPGHSLLDPVRRLIKRRSIALVADRRASVVAALRADGFELSFVNGGGTGSVASTSRDGVVTEVTIGSGFLCPTIFDHYDGLDLHPAAFFALPVVRRSDPDHVTCAGGGYVASGAAGPDRLPTVHLPRGLSPLGMEGWGEVQTPFRLGPRAPTLQLGDPVLARHAKAGELMERFASCLLVRGEAVVDEVPTYRGLGGCFL